MFRPAPCSLHTLFLCVCVSVSKPCSRSRWQTQQSVVLQRDGTWNIRWVTVSGVAEVVCVCFIGGYAPVKGSTHTPRPLHQQCRKWVRPLPLQCVHMCYKTDECGLKGEKKGRAHWSVSTITGQNKMEGNQVKMSGSVEELDIWICLFSNCSDAREGQSYVLS